MTADPRIVHGARCAWWDSIDKVATTASGLPCCPHCGGVLYETENEAAWWADVDDHEAKGATDYRAFITWLRGRCFPTVTDARMAWELERRPAPEPEPPSDRPQIELTVENCWCPRHLERFRPDWPKGYAVATPLVFTAFSALPEVHRYCGAHDGMLADAHRLQAAIAEFGPCCCAIDAAMLNRILTAAIAGDIDEVKAIHAELLNRGGDS